VLDRWGRQLNSTKIGPMQEGEDIILSCRVVGGKVLVLCKMVIGGFYFILCTTPEMCIVNKVQAGVMN
jgi:hypothetical protein